MPARHDPDEIGFAFRDNRGRRILLRCCIPTHWPTHSLLPYARVHASAFPGPLTPHHHLKLKQWTIPDNRRMLNGADMAINMRGSNENGSQPRWLELVGDLRHILPVLTLVTC